MVSTSLDTAAENSITANTANTLAAMNLLTRYTFSPHLEASLDIRNLFDEDAEDTGFGTTFRGDIPLPGGRIISVFAERFKQWVT